MHHRFAGWSSVLVLAACGSEPGKSGMDAGDDAGTSTDVLAAPTDVNAADGSWPFHVTVQWSPVVGASGYRVLRDGAPIGDTEQTTYFDASATPGGAPSAPAALIATQGTRTDGVELTWVASQAAAGTPHVYSVIALAGSTMSAASVDDSGYRAAYPVTYELQIDGGAFESIGSVTAHLDTAAPLGVIDPGDITVSNGTATASITMSIASASASPGESRSYSLRAVNASGTGPAVMISGYRGVGTTFTRQWLTSGVEVPGAVTTSFTDTRYVPAAEPMLYTCRVSVAGALDALAHAWATRAAAASEVPRSDAWITDGSVTAIALRPGLLYLGGIFRYIGPPTGGFSAVDATTGVPDLAFPRVSGTVNAAISDGAGGWYIAGSFSHIDGTPLSGIAHITSAGEVDPGFVPEVNGAWALALGADDTLYVAGAFATSAGPQGLVALDATTGSRLPWSAGVSPGVTTIALSADTLYLGGEFSMVDGVSRPGLAAVNAQTGALLPWNPSPGGHTFNSIYRLLVAGSVVYVTGFFTTIGGQSRSGLAAVDAATGNVTAWDPGTVEGAGAMVLSGTTLYVAGSMFTAGNQTRTGIAAYDMTTGQLTSFSTTLTTAWALAVSGNTLYVGGDFRSNDPQQPHRLAALDATTGSLQAWNPRASGLVRSLEVAGNMVFVAGEQASVGGVLRRNLAALDTTTYQPTAWAPGADNGVLALATSGDTIYVGGLFANAGGQPRRYVAAIDATTGLATAWNPDPSSQVRAIAVNGSTVYLGGLFSSIGGQARSYLGAVDATTAAPTAWNPGANNMVLTLASSEGAIYAGGAFTAVGGQTRHRIAAIDPTTGTPTGWNPVANNAVHDIDLATDGTVYIAGAFTNVGGQDRTGVAALAPADGTALAFDAALNGTARSIAVRANSVVIGGTFYTLGGLPHSCMAEVSLSGTPLAWNAHAPSEQGTSCHVDVVSSAPDRIHIGGWFYSIAGHVGRGLAIFER